MKANTQIFEVAYFQPLNSVFQTLSGWVANIQRGVESIKNRAFWFFMATKWLPGFYLSYNFDHFSQCYVLIDIWYQDTMVPTQVDGFSQFQFQHMKWWMVMVLVVEGVMSFSTWKRFARFRYKLDSFFLFFTPCGMPDLSYPTRIGTCAPYSGSVAS